MILADGTCFEGRSIGALGTSMGETVFATGMTGCLETLTDPSYYGQIAVQTFPLIGNYGVIPQDFESQKSWVSGYVVRELCDQPSNFRCQGPLDDFLKAQKIVGVCGIDTRALAKRLREKGVMNGMILSEDAFKKQKSLEDLLQKIRSYKIQDAVQSVCRAKEIPLVQKKSEKKLVALYDFGAKENIMRELKKRGAETLLLPFDAKAEDVLSLNPDGIMLSNGPGDPAENKGSIDEVKKLCAYGKIPIFGICLGHQILALARGGKTLKLKYGHRGSNHPVKDEKTGRVYITSQNHGYAVDPLSLPSFARMTFSNANDGTCEGLEYSDIPAFSVQFHPEACAGPRDTNFLFDKFFAMMNQGADARGGFDFHAAQ